MPRKSLKNVRAGKKAWIKIYRNRGEYEKARKLERELGIRRKVAPEKAVRRSSRRKRSLLDFLRG